MTIKAQRLKESEIPEKTRLYQIRNSRDIAVEERQADDSLDQVILEYHIENGDIGFFAKEYRPADVPKTGAKVIDITAVLLDHSEHSARWHLYDIKDSLAGENTVIKLYEQWNLGSQYLQDNILDKISGYTIIPDLGVITREYDEERMERLRDRYKILCNEIETQRTNMTLAQRKRKTGIAKYRGILRAAQAILDKDFRSDNGTDTYEIHIRLLHSEKDRIYKMRFPV